MPTASTDVGHIASSESDRSFIRKIETEEGQELRSCLQCGACSGVCPVSGFMDYTPRQIVGMARSGLSERLLKSRAIWYCASCYACTEVCPKKIPITEIIHALKREAIARKTYPKRFAPPLLTRSFHGVTTSRGRSNDGLVMLHTYLREKPLKHLGMIRIAGKLWLKGRLELLPDAVKNRADFTRLVSRRPERVNGAKEVGP